MRPPLILISLPLFLGFSGANVEKTIFIAPPASALPTSGPTFDSLQLQQLSHAQNTSTLRTELQVAFPNEKNHRGISHWFLLDRLVAGQRYEVRVCWAATQPTEFWLDAYSPQQVFDTSSLVSHLAEYAGTVRNTRSSDTKPYPLGNEPGREASILLLHIQAAADYYSTNATLMQHPPPVVVDIILDPYLLNIFPRSLVPTGLYITIVAGLAWVLSGSIYRRIYTVAHVDPVKKHAD